jgi:hypothetical protein
MRPQHRAIARADEPSFALGSDIHHHASQYTLSVTVPIFLVLGDVHPRSGPVQLFVDRSVAGFTTGALK